MWLIYLSGAVCQLGWSLSTIWDQPKYLVNKIRQTPEKLPPVGRDSLGDKAVPITVVGASLGIAFSSALWPIFLPLNLFLKYWKR